MKFMVDDLEVIFPYDYIYPEQVEYMHHLKVCLDGNGGHCLLEMPTGTGKTVTLLSFVLSYLAARPRQIGKLVYCTRTVQEMDKVVEELRLVVAHRLETIGRDRAGAAAVEAERPVLGVCLSARRNLCVHPEVSRADNLDRADSLCRNRTASFVREQKEQGSADVELCDFYEGFLRDGSDASIGGVYSLDDMRELGRQRGWCPYFLARHLINRASVVVYNYQYLLDPKISNMVSREIGKDSIVVFDEAHNIDNVCIEALSVTLNRQTVQQSNRNVAALGAAVAKMEQADAQRLQDEYQNLVRGLYSQGPYAAAPSAARAPAVAVAAAPAAPSASAPAAAPAPAGGFLGPADLLAANPVLSEDVLREAMPASVRTARHFVRFLRSFVEFLKDQMRGRIVTQESPRAFVRAVAERTRMSDPRALLFTYDRLVSLMRTLRIADGDEFAALAKVATFASLVATYDDGFTVLFEPYDRHTPTVPDPLLQLCCLDASLAMRPVFARFRSVVITSGTLSPLSVYPKILNFQPKVSASLRMTLARECICPMVVTKGSDQLPMTTRYEQRQDRAVQQNYGHLVLSLAKVVPDGMVCFFTSYAYMEEVIATWDADNMKVLDQILQHKLIFMETKDIVETTMALDAFKKACDCGRGAIFFSIARGKVAEGVDFDGHYGRAVVLLGVPFQYTLSRVLHARLVYLRERFQLQEGEFLTFDAMRQASQCVGRVIRSKSDYGIMIFADLRYARADKRRKLPEWIQQRMHDENTNLSVDRSVQVAQDFLRSIAQPLRRNDNLGLTLLTPEQATEYGRPGRGGGGFSVVQTQPGGKP